MKPTAQQPVLATVANTFAAHLMSTVTFVRTHPVTALSVWVLAIAGVSALGWPWLAPADPQALHDALLAPPSAEHLLGTDRLGRDVLSRLMAGAQRSGQVAIGSVTLALLVGGWIGLVAGTLGGWVDALISRSLDGLFTLPEILLALVVVAILGPGLGPITLAIAVVYTPIFARIARGAAQQAIAQPYIEAARMVGVGRWRLIWRHVLPNCTGPLVVQTSLSLAFAILAEAALSYLGLAGEPDAPSWGQMLRQGTEVMELAWWPAVFPGVCISLVVLAFNQLGDALTHRVQP